jgi:uncharacterized protein YceK
MESDMHFRLALCSLALVILSGCGTAQNVILPKQPMRVYGGVQRDLEKIGDGVVPRPGAERPVLTGLWGLVDLPFSAVGDTLTLPVTVPAQCSR